MMIVCKST